MVFSILHSNIYKYTKLTYTSKCSFKKILYKFTDKEHSILQN